MSTDTEIGHITQAGTNLFLDLGFDPKEAERLHSEAQQQINDAIQLKIQLMEALAHWIEEQHLKQNDAATILHVSRPRISDLVNKKTSKFTLDALVTMLNRVGKPVRFVIG